MTALAKIHIAKKDLAMGDDAYRDLLERITGQRTAKGLSDAELMRVIAEFGRLGWKPTAAKAPARQVPELVVNNKKAGTKQRAARKPSQHPFAKKARAMWISLYHLGVVRDRSEAALESLGKRQLGVEVLDWADRSHTDPLIEALKGMATRAGWLQVGNVLQLKRALVKAQMRILANRHMTIVPGVVSGCADTADEQTLDRLVNDLGRQIRGEA